MLICLDCNSVFNLDYEWKECKCGHSKGKYIDNLNAIFEGDAAVPLGFSNASLITAINNQPDQGLGEEFTAFVIPRKCPTFRKNDELDKPVM
ncbi:hypothetical protein [Anaerobacillus alkalilacustris]|uniref:hypothetical protein n=1 Tax=Anaerobacillus alkalilacustris TaxID=393763 RepID=UPI001FE06D81|nr:hypothetical protein [Anaerobacillus alkalilacustris]